MEANRVESERCVELAQKYLREGSRQKALKFLLKADKLCPSERITGAGEDIPNGCSGSDYATFDHYSENSKSSPSFAANESEDANLSSASKSAESASSSKTQKKRASRDSSLPRATSQPQLGSEYTQEQLTAVKRIRQAKDYYEILGLAKDFSEIDIKKAYRKLALQFHPDKNKAPGTAEAFKAIGNAYACLSEPEKRKRYDLYGTDTPSVRRRNSGSREDEYSHGFEAEFSPEEIFNMFFGGGFPSGSVYRRRTTGGHTFYEYAGRNHQGNNREDQSQRQENSLSVVLQLMPILILVVLSLFSSFLVGDPAYSLHKNSKYMIERRTTDLKVSYFVKSDFIKQYGGNIPRVDAQVEDDYISTLRSNCFREKSQKETLLWRARTYGDAHLYEKAQRLQTPSCDRLAEIYA